MKRREILVKGAAVGAGAWIAPSVLTISTANAQGGTPVPGCSCQTTISSNFNNTSIPPGSRCIWFNSHITKIDGMPATGGTIQFTSTVTIPSKGVTIPMPKGTIVFNPSVSSAVTTCNAAGEWTTTLPVSSCNKEPFVTGKLYTPTIDLKGSNPVTWSGTFSVPIEVTKVEWQWAAAVYTNCPGGCSALQVKPVDNSGACTSYNNNHQSGTPEGIRNFVVGGARGGGGSNYTGSNSATGKCQC